MSVSVSASVGPSRLLELDRGECLHRLAGVAVGRVVFTEAAMPAAHPVNFLLEGEEILFRTGPGSVLFAAGRGNVLAFQADHIDPAARTGWSVLAVGHAYEVTDIARLAHLDARLPTPWVPGRAGHTVAIPAQRLTGRLIGPA
ncbi:MAG: pyridoxamine 5'-phosphate oxidase family protein [Pseudonocardiaceae bacterium]|nr:MAG: pyridoxamine 5'-phosphate oxidase family protein [Pseudonocardiaceae bacterium]